MAKLVFGTIDSGLSMSIGADWKMQKLSYRVLIDLFIGMLNSNSKLYYYTML